ncbi:MAG TPA: TOBE domain-containing protein [Nannocystis exedens]|nr:TOBE domain-containing protein [Nannocystis exedens]
MNFIPATILADPSNERPQARLGDGSETLILPRGPALRPDQHVEIGVRPQDLMLCSEERASFQLKVEFVEFLGPEIHAHCVLAGTQVVACIEASAAGKITVGERLPLRIRKLHIFDQDSGRALR